MASCRTRQWLAESFRWRCDEAYPTDTLNLPTSCGSISGNLAQRARVMKIPVLTGVIDRRILVNFRVEPNVLAKLLPSPFRPKLVKGMGMAGVCLIRLQHLRPRFIPKAFGIASENAAHRIAVEWEQDGETREGVFIPRRDTSSRFNTLVGGRLFPGSHHHARFQVNERDGRYSVTVNSDDGRTQMAVAGSITHDLPPNSIFESVQVASEFFRRGSVGYSPTRMAGRFEGLELRSFNWSVKPLAVEEQVSSFFEDRVRFPKGSVHFDCALLMTNIEHEWHARQPIGGHSID